MKNGRNLGWGSENHRPRLTTVASELVILHVDQTSGTLALGPRSPACGPV